MVEENKEKQDVSFDTNDAYDFSSKKQSTTSSLPLIAGVILIISGILSIIYFAFIMSLDVSTLSSYVDIEQLKSIDPNITILKLKESLNICASVFVLMSLFPILGGILSIRKKLWGIALAGAIIGLFIMGPIFISSVLCLMAVIFIAISKKEFQ